MALRLGPEGVGVPGSIEVLRQRASPVTVPVGGACLGNFCRCSQTNQRNNLQLPSLQMVLKLEIPSQVAKAKASLSVIFRACLLYG